jgi:DNA-directed RNA polymerase specialized sigma24 family protein
VAKKQFRYLVRPDGTIRVVSKSVVQKQETDTLVTLTQYYRPGLYFWDFNLEQMVAYTDEQLAERRQAKLDEQAAKDADLTAKKERLGRVLNSLTPDQREAVTLIADIANVDLSS